MEALLAAPPVDGKANDECVRFFAEFARVPRSRVRIVTGLTSRIKVVEIEGVPQEDLERRLDWTTDMNLADIQQELRKQKLDGWLFFDHHLRDPLAYRILGLHARAKAHAPLVLHDPGARASPRAWSTASSAISWRACRAKRSPIPVGRSSWPPCAS